MKRSKEVFLIVDALIKNGLIQSDEAITNTARHVVREAIKKIRIMQYEERQSKHRGRYSQ